MALHSQIQRAARTPAGDIADQAWWALGDAPVRVAETLTPLVDGRSAMLAMCAAFLSAKETIWLADWDLHARLLMVRGRDQRAGADGSPEQEALVERLRAAGLDTAAIELWRTGQLRVVDVLGFAAGRGVDVRVLLWDPYDPRGRVHMLTLCPDKSGRFLVLPIGATSRFATTCRSLTVPKRSAHWLVSACPAVPNTVWLIEQVFVNHEGHSSPD
jgi:phosphatidylserine/phosphatidylglycerophosphate/cardiolipin synthase-like enzyme